MVVRYVLMRGYFVKNLILSLLVDFGSLILTLCAWYGWSFGEERVFVHSQWFWPLFVVWVVVQYIFGLFEEKTFGSVRKFGKALFSAWVASVILGVVYFYFQPTLILTPRRFLLVLSFLSFALFGCGAYILRILDKRFVAGELYLLQGSISETAALKNLSSGFNFKGSLEAHDLLKQIKYGTVVVVSDENRPTQEVLMKLFELRRKGVRFLTFSALVEQVERKVVLNAVGDWWVLEFGGGRRLLYDRVKRLIDIFVSILGLLFFLSAFPFVALGVKFSSPGPIFFLQKRVGYNGKVIEVVKLRTMFQNSGNVWTKEGDMRITQFGKILRRLRLDELPQFWNILKGDMSLVGPRPEQVHIVEQMKKEIPFYDERHGVLPGLSGWAQFHVYAGSLEETKLKLEYDLYYIKHRSFWFDLEIILKTLAVIILSRGR